MPKTKKLTMRQTIKQQEEQLLRYEFMIKSLLETHYEPEELKEYLDCIGYEMRPKFRKRL